MRKAIVALLIFAACGGSDGGWSDQARRDFIAGCEAGGAPTEACECVQEKAEARYPDMSEDDTIPSDVVIELTQECVG